MLLRSVKNWLTVLILALVGLAMLVAYAYVVPPLRGRLDQQKLVDLLADGKVARENVIQEITYQQDTGQLVVPNWASYQYNVGRLALRINARIIVLTRNQVVSLDTGVEPPFDIEDYPIIGEALTSATLRQQVAVTSGGRYAATAAPLPAENGGLAGVVLVIAPLKDVDNAVAAVQRQLLLATILALSISLILGYLASYFIARRLKRIEQSAEAIAAGDLAVKVPDTFDDEIGQLAGAFNIMAERLKKAFAEVEHERDRVEVLLNDLSEGVVGLSADGAVMIANPAAVALLGAAASMGASLDEALPPEVADAWRRSHEGATVEAVVFVHGDRTLEATTYPVGGGADFTSIVVLRDVTARARLERARRDLIANASHEFKTPLFSLAGSLELIDEGELSPEEQREFLQIMRQQVDRLRNLAVSMLDLSRVEAGSFDLEAENVELATVIRSVLDEFQAQAQAKDVKLHAESGKGETAWSDEQRLAQVLRALVDNAVKFSPAGGTVTVTADGDERTATLVVSDEGSGIPEEELPLVFERFHRGSEERANAAGAGLGLSIARELVELLGGSITASSQGGMGASFTVSLPRTADQGAPVSAPSPEITESANPPHP